jgi:autotransporter translocation and assembly factor TamB
MERLQARGSNLMKMTIGRAAAVTTLSLLMSWALGGAEAETLSPTTTAGLQRLQGSWEGVLEGHEKEGKVSITITGNSLRYQGSKPAQWYDTTFTLPVGTNPQQLHATIKASAALMDVGKRVFAIVKIENGTLTLAGIPAPEGQSTGRPSQVSGFEDNPMFRYDLRKVPPMRKAPQ